MDNSEKFEVFLGICLFTFLVLLGLKLIGAVTFSWIIIFLPVIIPALLIMKELGVFRR